MSNGRKIADLVVGTNVKVTQIDSDLDNTISLLKTRLDSDDAKLQSLDTAINAGIVNLVDSDLIINQLQSKINSAISNVDSDSTALQAANTQIGLIKSRLDSDEGRVQALGTSLASEISSTNTDISAIKGRLDSDDGRLQALDSSITVLKSRLDSDETTIQSAKTLIGQAVSSQGMADSDLKVVADLRNQLDSEITYVRLITLSYVNYTYTATAGQTSFSGTDANSLTLAYTAGSIQVFLNGVKLEDEDYTATDGTTVVLTESTQLGHQVTIVVPKFESNYVAPVITDWGGMQALVMAPKVPGTSAGSGQGYFGAKLAMSSSGEYAAVTAWEWTSGYNSSQKLGGFKIYKNNSSDYSDSTQWDKVASLHKLPAFSGGPTGAQFSGLSSVNGQRFGYQPIWINEDASKVVIPHIPKVSQPEYQSLDQMTMFVLSRTDSDFSDYGSFNPYEMASDQGNDDSFINSQSVGVARHFDVDKNVERIAYYFPKYTSNKKLGGICIVKRTGTTWALEAQFDAEDAVQTGLFTGNNSNTPDMGASGVVMNEDGDKIVCSNRFGAGSTGRRGAIWTFTRSGTSWSMPNGGTIYDPRNYENNWGESLSISKDGNYLAVGTSPANNASNDHNEVRIYVWNSSTNAWDHDANVQPGADGGPSYVFTDKIGPIALNRDGTILGMLNSRNDDSDNSQTDSGLLRIYKRSGSTWSLVNTKFGADLFSEVATYSSSHGTAHQVDQISISDSGATIMVSASNLASDSIHSYSPIPRGCVGILHDS